MIDRYYLDYMFVSKTRCKIWWLVRTGKQLIYLVFSRIFMIASKIGETLIRISCQVSGQTRGRIPDSNASKKLARFVIRNSVKLVNLAPEKKQYLQSYATCIIYVPFVMLRQGKFLLAHLFPLSDPARPTTPSLLQSLTCPLPWMTQAGTKILSSGLFQNSSWETRQER
jgi:hypothetical protein